MRSIEGATILITGGSGSLGGRVAAKFAAQGANEIRIYSRDENRQWEMAQEKPGYRYVIGDVRDAEKLAEVMRGVDFVFHTAALKQVPVCERDPWEAVKTNVIGTRNVCVAAVAAKVIAVVALSTDKAVRPIGTMGTTKALMEKIVCDQKGDTIFSCVRYGNIMGSRGSVIPLFKKMIDAGQPMRVTVPHMTRFMMTPDQAVDLVRHATENAVGGEIFVRKAPACTVGFLANVMAQKYSSRGEDHPIEVIGIRPGEKIHEALVDEAEVYRTDETEDYFTIAPEGSRPRTYYGQSEYASNTTRQIENYDELSRLLDVAGPEGRFS